MSLKVRYEDLKSEGAVDELMRIRRFLLQDQDDLVAFNGTELNGNATLEGPPRGAPYDAEHGLRMVRCAMSSHLEAYRSPTRHNGLFYGLRQLSTNNTMHLVEGLGEVLCQLGYDRLLARVLLRNETEGIDDIGRQVLSRLNCTEMKTRVDFSLDAATLERRERWLVSKEERERERLAKSLTDDKQ
jgi:hypothetical protein